MEFGGSHVGPVAEGGRERCFGEGVGHLFLSGNCPVGVGGAHGGGVVACAVDVDNPHLRGGSGGGADRLVGEITQKFVVGWHESRVLVIDVGVIDIEPRTVSEAGLEDGYMSQEAGPSARFGC